MFSFLNKQVFKMFEGRISLLVVCKHQFSLVCEFSGLKSHPQYELAKRQMRGFSGMVTFYIKGGLEESSVFLKALKVNNGHWIRLQRTDLLVVSTTLFKD